MRARYVVILSSLFALLCYLTLTKGLEYVAVQYVADKPWSAQIKDPMMQSTEVLDRSLNRVGEFSTEQRYYVSLNMIPKHVVQAFLAAEDADFYSHSGVSFKAMLRAAFVNFKNSKFTQGGSTITQQLARLYFLTPAKTLERKMEEVFLAIAMEKNLSKDRILELYLNKIFLGNHSYGVEAASRNYFRKSVQEINVAEAAMLAGLPAAPSKYAPHRFFRRAKKRQVFVLERMREEGYLDQGDKKRWQKHELNISKTALKKSKQASFYIEALRERLVSKFSISDLSQSGLQILTSLDESLQRVTNKTFAASVYQVFGSVDSKELAMALVILDVKTGGVMAMQGGASFAQSQFNLATYARRPIGSAFLPIYYTLAIDRGFRLDSSLFSRGKPVDGNPQHGDMSLYQGISGMRAEESARLLAWLGIGTVTSFSESLGLHFTKKDLSLALGTGLTNLMAITGSYGMLPRYGKYIEPFLVDAIRTPTGEIYFERPKHLKAGKQVVDPKSAFIISDILSNSGRSEAVGIGVDRSLHDSWVIGYDQNHVMGIWVGSKNGSTVLAKSKDKLIKMTKQLWKLVKKDSGIFSKVRGFEIPKGIGYQPLEIRLSNGRLERVQVPYRLDRM